MILLLLRRRVLVTVCARTLGEGPVDGEAERSPGFLGCSGNKSPSGGGRSEGKEAGRFPAWRGQGSPQEGPPGMCAMAVSITKGVAQPGLPSWGSLGQRGSTAAAGARPPKAKGISQVLYGRIRLRTAAMSDFHR